MNNDVVKQESFWGEWYIEELLGKDINSEVYKIYKEYAAFYRWFEIQGEQTKAEFQKQLREVE